MKKFIPLLAIIFLRMVSVSAQSTADFRINEFLVLNDSGYIDDFGVHNPWIEIFNSAYNNVNIEGCYLTNDLSKPTLYPIPTGDEMTKMPGRSFLVFWADNKPDRGILHLNFDLRHSKFIALFDIDGKTLIDSVSIQPSRTDVSYGRAEDGGTLWKYHIETTPKASNQTEPKEMASAKMQKLDPFGVGMTVIAMSVVFLVLLMVFLLFKQFSNSVARNERKAAAKILVEGETEISEEMAAAIGLALHFYQKDMADYENLVLTINKVSRTYSPWSSKLYGLAKWPRAI